MERLYMLVKVFKSRQLGVYIDELLSYAFPNRTRFASEPLRESASTTEYIKGTHIA